MGDIGGNDDPDQKLWMYSQWYNYPMNTLHNIVFAIFWSKPKANRAKQQNNATKYLSQRQAICGSGTATLAL